MYTFKVFTNFKTNFDLKKLNAPKFYKSFFKFKNKVK